MPYDQLCPRVGHRHLEPSGGGIIIEHREGPQVRACGFQQLLSDVAEGVIGHGIGCKDSLAVHSSSESQCGLSDYAHIRMFRLGLDYPSEAP